jgi:hypothetical protein
VRGADEREDRLVRVGDTGVAAVEERDRADIGRQRAAADIVDRDNRTGVDVGGCGPAPSALAGIDGGAGPLVVLEEIVVPLAIGSSTTKAMLSVPSKLKPINAIEPGPSAICSPSPMRTPQIRCGNAAKIDQMSSAPLRWRVSPSNLWPAAVRQAVTSARRQAGN